MGKGNHETYIKPHEDRFKKNERDVQKLFGLYEKITAPDGYLSNLEDELEAKIEKIMSKFNVIIILLASNLVAIIVKLLIKTTG